MTVKVILSRKGTSVVTIPPETRLGAAAKTLTEHRIGAAIVMAPGKGVQGMLSERDIVRSIAQHGSAALDLTVDQVMTRRVVTCTEADTVSAIMELMTSGKFRHVPVLEGDRLAGIVSIGDVVKHRLNEVETESNAMRDYILTA